MQNGVHYWFTTREKFEKGIEEGKFLEYAYVHGNIYGTSLKARHLGAMVPVPSVFINILEDTRYT